MYIRDVLWQQIHVQPDSETCDLPDLHRAIAHQMRVCEVLGMHRGVTGRALQEALIASGQVEEWRK